MITSLYLLIFLTFRKKKKTARDILDILFQYNRSKSTYYVCKTNLRLVLLV